jgi:hypothetical protein
MLRSGEQVRRRGLRKASSEAETRPRGRDPRTRRRSAQGAPCPRTGREFCDAVPGPRGDVYWTVGFIHIWVAGGLGSDGYALIL